MAGYAETAGLRTFMYTTGAVFAENRIDSEHYARANGLLGDDAEADYSALLDDADPRPTVTDNLLDFIAKDAKNLALQLDNAQEAVLAIRDRAEAAKGRGLRQDDLDTMNRMLQFLAAGINGAERGLGTLDTEVTKLTEIEGTDG